MYKKKILSWQQALLDAATGGKKATLTECYNEVISMYGIEKNAIRSWFRRYRKNHPEYKVVLSSKAIMNEPIEKEKKQKPETDQMNRKTASSSKIYSMHFLHLYL